MYSLCETRTVAKGYGYETKNKVNSKVNSILRNKIMQSRIIQQRHMKLPNSNRNCHQRRRPFVQDFA